jgi:tRNA(Ile)-lysidine synthase
VSSFRRSVAPWSARLRGIEDLVPGTHVVVGCSGGADSLALLALARARDLDVTAVYVDHGLRGGTGHDAAVVRGAARAVGAAARVVAVAIDPGANLEARARHARYAALEQATDDTRATAILVGHTLDDQAETVLLAMLRGSGTTGLAGMPIARGRLRRPLLEVRRAETREMCARLGWAPVHDPMNDEIHHRRVWLRREVMPQLARGAQRDLAEVLARQAAVLRDDDELLEALAAGHGPDDAAGLAALPLPVARRVVRRWLGPPPPSSSTVDAVLAVARGERRAAEIPGGRRVERVGARLHLVSDRHREQVAPAALGIPGRARLGDLVIDTWIEDAPPAAWPDGRLRAVADADLVGAVATLRVPRIGERFRPLGRGGSKLVRDALVEAGVPAGRRAHAPIVSAGSGAVVAADSAIWVVGYRIDDRVRVTARTRRYLWMSVEPNETF